MRGIPGLDAVSPGGVALDRLPTGSGNYLERAAVGVRELFGRPQSGEGVGRAVDPDDDLARPPRAVVGRIGE